MSNHLTYLITLEDESNLPIVDELKSYDINPIIFKGVNGKTIDEEIIEKHIHPKFKNILSKGCIGCALSHLSVWKEFLKTDEPYCIIFEDDLRIVPDFKNKLDNLIKNTPSDFDILSIGYFNTNINYIIISLISHILQYKTINDFIITPSYFLATHAYIVSRNGAEQLINSLDGFINNHIDVCINNTIFTEKLNFYAASPRIAFQTSCDGAYTIKSFNNTNYYPYILYKLASNIYIDEGLTLDYMLFFNLIFNINIVLILFFIIGIFIAIFNIKIKLVTTIFLILSIPDFLCINKKVILLYYLALILPSLLFRT